MKPAAFAASLPLAGLLLLVLGSATSMAADPEPLRPPVELKMVRDDAVHRELELNQSQRQEFDQAIAQVDGRWWRSRILRAEKQKEEIGELTSILMKSIGRVLDTDQRKRFLQLRRQALGTRMVFLKDVIQPLQISESQLAAMRAASLETDREVAKLQERLQKGDATSEEAQKETQRLQSAERETLVSTLSNDQRIKLDSLTGAPFNFAQIKRTFPRAPELESAGVTWVQGSPVSLEELRGQVVAVHFYAFQCINCQRNFPHYQGWQEDYAGKGLKIIGIQTPETSAERKLDRVRLAAKKDGFAYDVIMDADSSNWKAWGNTMWPTVYLIDKKGFIRRWWQGEMNWQGTPGEKQMRSTIEQLLAEND